MKSIQGTSPDLPPALRSVLDDLAKSDQEAQRIVGGLSDSQANWQPSPNAWSIAQCLDHLTRANTVYAAALAEGLSQSGPANEPWLGPIRPGWPSRYFIRSLEPPPKNKLRAPKKIVPASQIGSREVLAAFLRSQEDVRAVIKKAAGLDLNRIRFRNPFIGFLRFTVGTGLLVITAHDRRHLWQAERVHQSAGFPAS